MKDLEERLNDIELATKALRKELANRELISQEDQSHSKDQETTKESKIVIMGSEEEKKDELNKKIIKEEPEKELVDKEKDKNKTISKYKKEELTREDIIRLQRKSLDRSREKSKIAEEDISKVKKENTLKTENQEKTDNVTKQSSFKLKESLIGRYLIGIIASLLIFIAAVSFVALIWDKLTPVIKLSVLFLSGSSLTTLGFILLRKNNNPINSIILGIGSGLVFISIISSFLMFELISKGFVFLLLGIWTLLFIYAYEYIESYLTIIIASIGSYIGILLALTSVVSDIDIYMTIVFMLAVVASLLFAGKKWFKDRLLMSLYIISIVDVATVYTWISFGNWSNIWIESRSLLAVSSIGLIIILYYLTNLVHKVKEKNEKGKYLYLVLDIIVSLIVVLGIESLGVITPEVKPIIYITIFSLQIFINEKYNKKIRLPITMLYSVALALSLVRLNSVNFNISIGFSAIACILFLIDSKRKEENYNTLILILIALESFYAGTWYLGSNKLIISIYTIVNFLIIYHFLKARMKNKNIEGIKIFAYIALSIMTAIPLSIVFEDIYLGGQFLVGSATISYIGLLALNILLIRLGYFKDWLDENFYFSHSDKIEEDQSINLFYIETTIMFFLGVLVLLGSSQIWQGRLIEILMILVLALVQTTMLVKRRKNINFTGVWIGLKYLILTWSVLNVSYDLGFTSIYISVSGFVIALLSITYGFAERIKSLRLYGLVLTMLMTLKFVLIDLSGENSVARVISFLVGGLIAFSISALYNKLNNIIED